MIRWSYILPRLFVLAALWACLRWGLDPLTRWALVIVGQAATGAKVEIGATHVSLRDGRLAIDRAAIANPKKPDQNLVEFSSGVFQVDKRELMQRRIVIERAALTDLKIDTDRVDSGRLPVDPHAPSPDGSADMLAARRQLQELGSQWLDQFSDRLKGDLQEQFVSARVARELIDRWSREYEDLERSADAWKGRIDEIEEAVRQLRDQPLRDFEFYQERLAEMRTIRDEILKLKQRIEQIQRQASRDRHAIRDAKDRDVDQIRQMVQIENIDAQTLAEYLVGDRLAGYLDWLVYGIEQGRSVLSAAGKRPDWNQTRGRGTTISFDPGTKPEFLIRSLGFAGTTTHDQQPIAWSGVLENVTSQPEVLGLPTILKIQTSGSIQAELKASIDRTTATPRERIVVHLPKLELHSQTLGDPQRLSLAMAPGAAELYVDVELEGDKLGGQVIVKQKGVGFTANATDRLGGTRLAEGLTGALADVREFDLVLKLGGTIPRPKADLETDLGQKLATGLRGAVDRELEFRRDQLLAASDALIEKQTARLESLLGEKEQQLAQKLQASEKKLDAFKQSLVSKLKLPNGLYGKAGGDSGPELPALGGLPGAALEKLRKR